ncbi:uncharacterized protein LOC129941212 [Eupeodes corollae]|uniref:uncharacterized protein LOC129941212 n=1 Tax=Eupeodes corollae TaxID=290404 RepID=UPI0024935DB1|nr:uncharacterized protein LOC129941212 [Eupeodes corollae]
MANKIITNRAQFQRLFEMLQEKPEIAQGYSKIPKEEINAFWEQVKTELNSSGPPSKDATAWRKVWLDWKAYIKRKMTENKKESKATGGGSNKMHTFSILEESVIRLTGLETSTGGIKGTVSFGGTNATEPINSNANSGEEQAADVSMTSDVDDLGSIPQRRPTTYRQPNDTASLLKEQVEIQKEFYSKSEEFWKNQEKNAEGISSSLRRINRAAEKLCEIEEKRLEETKRHNKIKEELLQQKLQIKMQMVQIKEARSAYSPK